MTLHALQVRALAVCRAWRKYLDPRLFPVDTLFLPGFKYGFGSTGDPRVAEWIIVTQPAVRSLSVCQMPSAQLTLMLSSIQPVGRLSQCLLAVVLQIACSATIFVRFNALGLKTCGPCRL